ncbi:MAG: hypothetical protein KFH98_07550 [Gemmatimonadetes bacterium]|nr:hypothetical protein [Gemmatimonadota bacterium]
MKNRLTIALATGVLCACVVSACASSGAAGTAGAGDSAGAANTMPTPAPGATPSEAGDTLVAAGYGTLRQDDITVSLRSGAVLVKVTPLTESVIRLTAPDTYNRLTSLRMSRSEEASQMTMGEPELVLVSFFSYEPDASFQPEDLQIVYQSRLLRPSLIIPLTGGWGRQRLDQQETQTAIYGFDTSIDFGQVMTVRYGMQESEQWRQTIVRLENERAQIRSRIRQP